MAGYVVRFLLNCCVEDQETQNCDRTTGIAQKAMDILNTATARSRKDWQKTL